MTLLTDFLPAGCDAEDAGIDTVREGNECGEVVEGVSEFDHGDRLPGQLWGDVGEQDVGPGCVVASVGVEDGGDQADPPLSHEVGVDRRIGALRSGEVGAVAASAPGRGG